MILVIGGSASGKSAWAENYMAALSEEKYYIATMSACDSESKRRIDQHRKQREGKGFITVEQPVDIQKAAGKMKYGIKPALLECISNLAANEMFAGVVPAKEEIVAEKIVMGIAALMEEVLQLVIVSNNVFEDGRIYDDTSMAYIRAMGQINARLAAMADEAVEVVAGIPVRIKGRQKGTAASCIW